MTDDLDDDAPFKRQRENKYPWPSGSGTGSFVSSGSTQFLGSRYVCPRCGGEFSKWDTPKKQDRHFQKGLKHKKRERLLCPFCGLKRGDYNPDEDS